MASHVAIEVDMSSLLEAQERLVDMVTREPASRHATTCTLTAAGRVSRFWLTYDPDRCPCPYVLVPLEVVRG